MLVELPDVVGRLVLHVFQPVELQRLGWWCAYEEDARAASGMEAGLARSAFVGASGSDVAEPGGFGVAWRVVGLGSRRAEGYAPEELQRDGRHGIGTEGELDLEEGPPSPEDLCKKKKISVK